MFRIFCCSTLIILPCSIVLSQTPYESIPDNTQSPNAAVQNSYKKLFLMVYINDSELPDLLPFQQDAAGNLSAYAKDLRQNRIKIATNISDYQLIPLNSFDSLKYRYDEASQSIYINLPSSALKSYSIDLKGQDITNDDLLKLNPLNAAILNYSVYNTRTNDYNYLSGNIETLFNSRYGNFTSRFLFNDTQDSEAFQVNSFVRLDTFWQYIDPVKIRSYIIGDYITNTSDWGNSIRLTGFQWSSAYDQRSDIITAVLPHFSGSAVLPSTLDLFVNQQKIYSGEIPSGPFDLKALPFINGNEVTLITKNATGQQIESTQAYYYSPKILAQGTRQFSVDIGLPRYEFGLKSNNYDKNVVMGSGSLRYGYNNALTLSGNVESSTDGLINIGGGGSAKTLNKAVITMNMAGSQYKHQKGFLAGVGVESRLSSNLSFNADYQYTSEDYFNQAKVTEQRYRKDYLVEKEDNNINLTAYAQDIFRAGLSWNFHPGYSLSTSYNKIDTSGDHFEMINLNLSTNLGKNVGLYASSYQDLNDSDNTGLYIGLNFIPSKKISATTSISHDRGLTGYRQEFNSINASNMGDFGWGAAFEQHEQKDNYATAYVNYRTHPAFLSARYSRFGDQFQSVFSATGALVTTSGRIFAANEVGDAYAIVENAGPGSKILNGGVNLGATDSKGRFFISNLSPYKKHSIYLDPTNLALEWQNENTEKQIITGYRQGTRIDFASQKSFSATAILHDKNHQPIAAGYTAELNQSNQAVSIGYEGQIFLDHLQPQNILKVDLLDHGYCVVKFDYKQEYSSTKKIGPFVCQ